MAWTFNKDYKDFAQVEPFWEAYAARYEELKAEGKYPYNDSFKGYLNGDFADSRNEDSAIYLLQGIRHLNEERQRIEAFREQGMVPIDALAKRRRFSRIVLYRPEHYVGGTGHIAEYEDARLVPDENGKPYAVLPKGARTKGYMVQNAQVLVLA